jgi:hypothetical protein
LLTPVGVSIKRWQLLEHCGCRFKPSHFHGAWFRVFMFCPAIAMGLRRRGPNTFKNDDLEKLTAEDTGPDDVHATVQDVNVLICRSCVFPCATSSS